MNYYNHMTLETHYASTGDVKCCNSWVSVDSAIYILWI